MKVMTVFGHRDFFETNQVEDQIKLHIKEKIEKEGFNYIYNGGKGSFDYFCAKIVKDIKKTNPHIVSALVLAYYKTKWNEQEKYFITEYFDEHFYPEINPCPPKFAIQFRNKWMIDHADYIIFYVNNQFGGAYDALLYAKRKKKKFINFGNLK